MKYLLTFEKGESARWLGHLDILRTFERAIRRAELPIAFSAGFNPREKIAFASALSVGITGAAELATIELTDAVNPEEVAGRLNAKLPPGIRIVSAREIPDAGSRDLLNSFDRAEMLVTCACSPDLTPQICEAACRDLLARTEIVAQREREGRVRTVDIRPYIHNLRLDALEGDRARFRLVLAVSQEGSAKPGEVISALADQIPGLSVRRIHRARLISGA